MKNDDLRQALSSLSTPPIDSAARERGLHRALIALAQPQTSPDVPVRAFASSTRRGAALAAFAVMLVVGFIVFREAAPRPGIASASDTAKVDGVTLAQMQALFPGQLNAVIERDGRVELDLAGNASPAANQQPLVVQLERGGHRLRVLSYSGRSITVELKSGPVTFEVLVTGDGEVVLSGSDFAWSSAQPTSLAGYRINAHLLNTTS